MARGLEYLLPFRRRQFTSELSASDASLALAGEVEPRRWLRFGWNAKTFQGTVGADTFDIQRIIRYRNSFLPRIRGTIQAETAGSSISVTMSLPGPVLIFLVVWLAIALTATFESMSRSGLTTAIAIVVFVWLMTAGGFAFEAAKAERALCKILRSKRS